jgi:hypothetical protein
MSDHDHPSRSTLLAVEELDARERGEVTEHLATCVACRALLTRLQDVEARAASVSGLPPLAGDPLADLSPFDREAAARSQRALLRTVQTGSGSGPGGRRWLSAGLAGALALAAVLTLVILGPGRVDERDAAWLFGDLRVGPAVVIRGQADAPGHGNAPAPEETISIRFTPARDGWPVVVRIGAAGAEVICPTEELPGWPLHADRPAVLPPPGQGVVWPAGATTCWLVALSDTPIADVGGLARGVAVAATDHGLAGDEAMTNGVRSWLEARHGPVGVVRWGAAPSAQD